MRRIWLGLSLVSLVACTNGDFIKKFQPRTIDEGVSSPTLLAERGSLPTIETPFTYYGLRKLSDESPGDPALAAMLVLSGMEQVDALCDDWFRQLALAQSELRAADDVVTTGGTALAGIFALTHAGLAATGATAVATGAAHSLLASTQANFIVAPDVAVVAETNRTLRAKEHECVAKHARAGELDNFNARKFIAEYAQMCTPIAIKELINQSISAIQPAKSSTNPNEKPAPLPATTGFCSNHEEALGTNVISSIVRPRSPVFTDPAAAAAVAAPIPAAAVPPTGAPTNLAPTVHSPPVVVSPPTTTPLRPRALTLPPDNEVAELTSAGRDMSMLLSPDGNLTTAQVGAIYALLKKPALSETQKAKIHRILLVGGLEDPTTHKLRLRQGKTEKDFDSIITTANRNGVLDKEVERLVSGL